MTISRKKSKKKSWSKSRSLRSKTKSVAVSLSLVQLTVRFYSNLENDDDRHPIELAHGRHGSKLNRLRVVGY